MNSCSIKACIVLVCLVVVAACNGAGNYNDLIIDIIDPMIEETGRAANAADQQSFDALEQRISETRQKLREIGPLDDDPELMNAAITMVDNIDDMAQKYLTELIRLKAQGEDYKVEGYVESVAGFLDAEIQMFDQQQKDFARKHGYQVERRPIDLPF